MSDLFDKADIEALEMSVATTKRINELVSLIKRYQDSYYNGEGEISDAEFDALWDELKKLDPSNEVFLRVGKDSGNFQKVRHIMPMGSQEKAANPDEFLSWAKKHIYPEYLVEYKLDGASLELQYENGILMRAITRGDGEIGDDITENAKKMQGVVEKLVVERKRNDQQFTGGVRGEVIMTHKVHREKFSDKANCRNAANGLMKRKDGVGSENLTLITYDALCTDGKSPFNDEEEKILWLEKCGFNVVPLKICKTSDEVIEYRAEVMEKRKTLDYDIDGLVVKERVINADDAKRARPDRQIAFKFSLEEAVSTLREVEWSQNGATYTPVAIFDEVELNGTKVQRASFSNPDTLRALNVKIGCKVVVVKRGEIIPKIERAFFENCENESEVVFPKKCETCGADLVDDGSRLYCPNKSCSKRILHKLLKWVQVADIRDLGETLVVSLFKSGKVRSISDFYALTVDDLVPFFLTDKSIADAKKSLGAEKVIRSIKSHTVLTLQAFVAGFDIEGIGETTFEKLIQAGYDTLEKLFALSADEIADVYGFALKMANQIVLGLKENADEMRKLKYETITIKTNAGGVFQGKSFCFTGELHTMKRSEAETLVKSKGGSTKSSVTKDLTYLVTNDTTSDSAKNKKAKELGIAVITEEEFLELEK